MTQKHARLVLGIGIPLVSVAGVIVPYLVFRSDLPGRLATHFDTSGTPDGSMATGAFLAVTLLMVLVGAAVCIWLARVSNALPHSVAPMAGFLGGFFAGLGAGIAAMTFVLQRGLASWTEADGVALLVLVSVLVAIAVGALAARAGSMLPVQSFRATADAQPKMDLAEDQHAVWLTTLHSRRLALLGAGFLVVGVLIGLATARWLLIPMVLSGAIILALATLQVRADRRGLHVRSGMLPWPRTNIDIEAMESASVIDVRPMEWGGWGYRGSLKLMKQAAVVHRAGPGIRIDLRGGKVFVITVDDPSTPVGLLNAEIARSPQPA